MKVLVLCSGGDSPGMNYCIYSLLKMGRKHNFYGAIAGYKGLINNNFIKLNINDCKEKKDVAGAFIKSSRCPEFKTQKGVDLAVKNINDNKFDCVIVLGGDGSYRGCSALVKNKIKCLFIPATIDRDLPYETYSIGFLSAVNACDRYITQVMNSFKSFDRTGVFEVMGRDNSSIAKLVARQVKADLCITDENYKTFKVENLDKNNKSQIIVLQENLLDINKVCLDVQNYLESEVKPCVISYLQRGADPVRQEKRLSWILAKTAIQALNKKKFNLAISLNENVAQTLDLK